MGIHRRLSISTAVSGPKWNVVYYVADRQRRFAGRFDKMREILDAWIDYASYVTDRCKSIEIRPTLDLRRAQIVARG